MRARGIFVSDQILRCNSVPFVNQQTRLKAIEQHDDENRILDKVA
jgi:hypothetical protein